MQTTLQTAGVKGSLVQPRYCPCDSVTLPVPWVYNPDCLVLGLKSVYGKPPGQVWSTVCVHYSHHRVICWCNSI